MIAGDVEEHEVGVPQAEDFFGVVDGAEDGGDGGILEEGAHVEIIFHEVHAGGTDDGGDGELGGLAVGADEGELVAEAEVVEVVEFFCDKEVVAFGKFADGALGVTLEKFHLDEACEGFGIHGDVGRGIVAEYFTVFQGGGFQSRGEGGERGEVGKFGMIFFEEIEAGVGDGEERGVEEEVGEAGRGGPGGEEGLAAGADSDEDGHADHEGGDHRAGAPGGAGPGTAEEDGFEEKDRRDDPGDEFFEEDEEGGAKECVADEDEGDARGSVGVEAEIFGGGREPEGGLERQADEAGEAGVPDGGGAGLFGDGCDRGHGGDARDLPQWDRCTERRGNAAVHDGDGDRRQGEFVGEEKLGEIPDEGGGAGEAEENSEEFADEEHDESVGKEEGDELAAGGADAAELPELADAFLHADREGGPDDEGRADSGNGGEKREEQLNGTGFVGELGFGVRAGGDSDGRAKFLVESFGIGVEISDVGGFLKFHVDDVVFKAPCDIQRRGR